MEITIFLWDGGKWKVHILLWDGRSNIFGSVINGLDPFTIVINIMGNSTTELLSAIRKNNLWRATFPTRKIDRSMLYKSYKVKTSIISYLIVYVVQFPVDNSNFILKFKIIE